MGFLADGLKFNKHFFFFDRFNKHVKEDEQIFDADFYFFFNAVNGIKSSEALEKMCTLSFMSVWVG